MIQILGLPSKNADVDRFLRLGKLCSPSQTEQSELSTLNPYSSHTADFLLGWDRGKILEEEVFHIEINNSHLEQPADLSNAHPGENLVDQISKQVIGNKRLGFFILTKTGIVLASSSKEETHQRVANFITNLIKALYPKLRELQPEAYPEENYRVVTTDRALHTGYKALHEIHWDSHDTQFLAMAARTTPEHTGGRHLITDFAQYQADHGPVDLGIYDSAGFFSNPTPQQLQIRAELYKHYTVAIDNDRVNDIPAVLANNYIDPWNGGVMHGVEPAIGDKGIRVLIGARLMVLPEIYTFDANKLYRTRRFKEAMEAGIVTHKEGMNYTEASTRDSTNH